MEQQMVSAAKAGQTIRVIFWFKYQLYSKFLRKKLIDYMPSYFSNI
jgi:hypothetical protein